MIDKHEDSIEMLPVLRYSESAREKLERAVALEYPLTIIFNNHEIATVPCTPKQLEYLAAGFLSSEGYIRNREEIKSLNIDENAGIVRLETFEDRDIDRDILHKRVIPTGGGRGAAFYDAADLPKCNIATDTKISVRDVISLISEFQLASSVYQSTRGVHSAALCLGSKIVVHADDIGRHNAIDKVFGFCLLEGRTVEGLIILTSGRIASEIVRKVAKKDVQIIVSVSAPTALAVKLARESGITLIASVREGKMDVYTHEERVVHKAGCSF